MIHMSQVKVPVKELVKKVEPELFCKGKIGKAEEELVKKAAAKLIKMPIEEITFFCIENFSKCCICTALKSISYDFFEYAGISEPEQGNWPGD